MLNQEKEKAKRKSHLADENPPNVYTHMRSWYGFANILAFTPIYVAFTIILRMSLYTDTPLPNSSDFSNWLCLPIFGAIYALGMLISIPMARFVEAQTATPSLIQSRKIWIAEATAGFMVLIYFLVYALIHFTLPQYHALEEAFLGGSFMVFLTIWVGTRSYLRKLQQWYDAKNFKQKSKEI